MAAPNTKRLDLAQTVQTLVAYVAAPAVLAYPFGFVVLWLQFVRYYKMDFYTGWYAVSLINRIVVLGMGATILFITLVGSVLLSWIVGRILQLKNSANSSSFYHKLISYVSLSFLSLIALLVYILYSRVLAAGKFSCIAIVGKPSGESLANALRHQLDLWPDSLIPAIIFLAGGLLGGFLLYRSYRKYRDCRRTRIVQQLYPKDDFRLRPRFFIKGITEGWIYSGLVTAYLSGILAALVLAFYIPSFLPFVTYGETVKYPGKHEPEKDRFLSHLEGHWYYIHRLGPNNSEPRKRHYRILALREEVVTYVRVKPLGQEKGRIAPFPWQERAADWYTQLCPTAKPKSSSKR